MKTLDVREVQMNCMSILDDIAKNGVEYEVTKNGEPIAMLVPMDQQDSGGAATSVGPKRKKLPRANATANRRVQSGAE